ncbi:ankyrin repeat domain-containing protein [Paenibacillus sp. SI8]|uniref:ankyrin repeat domain-containing protein n=1 Tax=unclassified Paenibacillus TaxID=185978 RepID=UPI003467664B
MDFTDVENERIEMVEFLLNHGADVDIKDNRGLSPIVIAKSYDSEKIIQFLEQYKRN